MISKMLPEPKPSQESPPGVARTSSGDCQHPGGPVYRSQLLAKENLTEVASNGDDHEDGQHTQRSAVIPRKGYEPLVQKQVDRFQIEAELGNVQMQTPEHRMLEACQNEDEVRMMPHEEL